MGTIIGPTDEEFIVEQPDSPVVTRDRAGVYATKRIYLIHKNNVADILSATTLNQVDPLYTQCIFAGIKISFASPSTRLATITYEQPGYDEDTDSIGTVTRSASANPILEPLEKILDSQYLEAAKADGIDGALKPQPVYRYKKTKASSGYKWTEANIISGVGKVDDSPTGIEDPTPNKWLMNEHTLREVGDVVEEEWGWQYSEDEWETGSGTTTYQIYDIWGGSAS